MGKLTREVTIEPDDGVSMTAHELMVACSQVPSDIKPKAFVKMNCEIKRIVFKIEVVPDGGS